MGEKNFYVRDDDDLAVGVTVVKDGKQKPQSIIFDIGGETVITIPVDQFEQVMQEYLIAKAGIK